MKSKRRHELQESALSQEWDKLRRFFRKWGNHVAWGGLIAAVIIAIAVYAYRSHTRQQQELRVRLSRLQTGGVPAEQRISELKELIAQDDNRGIAARAAVMLGEAYFARHVFPDSDVTPEQAEQALPSAEDAFRRAIRDFADYPRQVSRARYGLSKVLESGRRFDEAREQYRAILEMEGLEGDPVLTLARSELEAVDDLATPVELPRTRPAATTMRTTLPIGPFEMPETLPAATAPVPSVEAPPATQPTEP
jgi:hypothetical protein